MELIYVILFSCAQLEYISNRIENNISLTPEQKIELIETVKNYSNKNCN